MKWKPIDIVIIILALFISITIGYLIIASTKRTEPMPEASVKIIGDIYVGVIATIAVYVGSQINKK